MMIGQAMARPLQHEDERNALARGNLGQAHALGRPGIPDRPSQHGEVLGTGYSGTAVDPAEPGDQPVRWGRSIASLAQAGGEGADLDEAAGIEQSRQALAGIELALGAVPLQTIRPAHRRGKLPPPRQNIEDALPATEIRGHRTNPPYGI